MPSGQLNKHLTKTALNYYTFPFFTAILFMPFKFGRVRVLVPSMTCSKFKNPLFVLSLALHTILTRKHFLKSCKFYPSLTLFLLANFNSCNVSIKIFSPHHLTKLGYKNSIRNIGENDIQLRNFDQLRLTHANLTSLDLFPLYNFPKIWQDFPNEQIKIIRKPSEFDAKLKGFFLDDLASNVVCNRLFCPACSQAS